MPRRPMIDFIVGFILGVAGVVVGIIVGTIVERTKWSEEESQE